MILRNASGARTVLRIVFMRNWLAVLVVFGMEVGALELHRQLPALQSSAFSEAGVAVIAGAVGMFLSFR